MLTNTARNWLGVVVLMLIAAGVIYAMVSLSAKIRETKSDNQNLKQAEPVVR